MNEVAVPVDVDTEVGQDDDGDDNDVQVHVALWADGKRFSASCDLLTDTATDSDIAEAIVRAAKGMALVRGHGLLWELQRRLSS